ncbi:hypothetical protein [Morganella psychrotolerans]|uniref:Uncharacterized protein n=1 Tax=Morganella psychrotolerans TaxID=368603 RepID=A0A1B8HF83_9GAMM|nr:hypothetical protein [Morganella psychrotolerans]OBU07736.1 hypothetical protein AYY18_05795 [Morganella psychrotolerans]
MEITPDQKRAICTILVEQAGRRVRNTELTALCDDDTITAALHFLTRLIEIKHAEIAAGQAAALAELQSQNPQMVMGSLLSGSSLSVQNGEATDTEPAVPEAAVSNTPAEESTEETAEDITAKVADHIASIFSDKSLFPEFAEPAEKTDPLKNHNWLFEDTDTDDTDLPPLGVFSEPAVKQDEITEQPQATLNEAVAEPVEDTVTGSADKPAQPATAVLSDIFSFSGTPVMPQSEPGNSAVIAEAVQSEPPADAMTMPVEDHTEETAEETAEESTAKVADHIASIFSDKSLFPEFSEPAEKTDPLKNHSWLFEDTDTDDTDLPPLGVFSEPAVKQDEITEQPQVVLNETVAEPVEDTVTESADKPAQPATAVLSDVFSFSGTPVVPQSEPVNSSVIAEAVQSERPADAMTMPVEDHTEETAEETAEDSTAKIADHIASIFSDKSLFPEFAEPAEKTDPLKNHSWLFEDTDTDDTDLPPLGVFSEPAVKQDEITEQPQVVLNETVAEPVEDTVTESADKPAQPATAVFSDIFSFSGTPIVPQSEPVNSPAIAEAVQSKPPADAMTMPVEDHTEETAEETAEDSTAKVADHIASIFSDKSLFPEFAEPAEKTDPLKNHSWLFEDTDTDDTDLPPLGVFSEPAVKQDEITEQPQVVLNETVAEPVEDTVTESADKPAQPATAVLSDIFSFSGTPYNASAGAVTLPAEDNTENHGADHMTPVFSDKSLFPELSEPTEKPGQLKNHSWLFDDLDTDDSDTPAIGDLPAGGSHTTQDTLRSGAWLFDDADTGADSQNKPSSDFSSTQAQPEPTVTTLFNSLPPATKQQDNNLLTENWLFADDTDAADPKPWGLAALLAAGKTSGKNKNNPATTPAGPVFKDVTNDSKPATEPEKEKEQEPEHISLPPAEPADIMTTHSDTQADPLMPPAPTRPTIRIEVARARQNEPFNSPVTATLHDGRHVSVLGIYFQSSIGLNFNEKTSTLYGKPTDSGEFSLRVVWELTPKRRFSTDVTFFVSPDPHSPPPLPEIYASPAE